MFVKTKQIFFKKIHFMDKKQPSIKNLQEQI